MAAVPISALVLLFGCAKEPATMRAMAPGTAGSSAGIGGEDGGQDGGAAGRSGSLAGPGDGGQAGRAGAQAGGRNGASATGAGAAAAGAGGAGAGSQGGRGAGQSDGAVVAGQSGAQAAAAIQAAARPEPKEYAGVPEVRDIHFDFDKYGIRPDAAKTLAVSAQWFKSHPGDLILIEGHCDERGTSEYNIALGQHRAESARNYLVAQGVQANRITVVSYGEERPVCTEQTDECWAKNRRAHFLVKRP